MIRLYLQALAISVTLLGCSSTSSNNIEKTLGEVIPSNYPVYAKIEKIDNNSYGYTNFSFKEFPNSINLNTLQHNWNTEDAECAAGLVKSDKECSPEHLFRTGTIDSGDLVKNTVGNVFIAFYTIGLGTSAYYTKKFDHDEFKQAVEQANNNLDRVSFLKQVEKVILSEKKHLKKLIKEGQKKYDHITKKIKESTQIDDKSQLYIGKPQVEVLTSNVIKDTLQMPGQWSAGDDIATLIRTNSDALSNNYSIYLKCHTPSYFNVKTTGCEQKWSGLSKTDVKPVRYTINNARHINLHPKYEIQDSNLIVETIGSDLKLSNLTDKFITVDSVSIYLGKDIETHSKLEVNLPPQSSSNSLSLTSYTLYRTAALFNFSKKDLLSTKEVSMAIKYKVVDTNIEKTLYKKRYQQVSEMQETHEI